MKKYIRIFSLTALFAFASCDDFLDLQPEYLSNEDGFYKTEEDFETAIIGTYAQLQDLYNLPLIYLGDLTTDNSEIQWSSPTTSESECEELDMSVNNTFTDDIWQTSYSIITQSNTLIAKLQEVELGSIEEQYLGEAYFLRAHSYFNLVRVFGELPLITIHFTSPNQIAEFDMTRKPTSEIYDLIVSDLENSINLLDGIEGLGKSRASVGASKTLLGKVYLTLQNFSQAATVLKEVIDMNAYSLEDDYGTLFTNGNDELDESIFEVKYLSGNIGEGNSYSSVFTPPLFNIAIFPGNMQGSGRINPTADMANTYEPGDLRRPESIADSVLLLTGNYASNKYGLKFVDFTTGIVGDGGINFTMLRYADVLLMYAEALLETDGATTEAHDYLNLVRDRAGLDDLAGLSENDLALAIEHERRVEFYNEGHRWFDLVRTGRAQTVLNAHFSDLGTAFTLENHELIMPLPLREITLDPSLAQNPGYN
tara:strand:- start:33239 stop:34681 length:1443 start_codon:yes stop_codon:yes gene_type:complete